VIFTSGTQARDDRTVNHDPEPYVVGYDSAGPIRISGTGLSERVWVLENNYLARPEFDVLDNSVLALFRKQRTPLIPIRAHAIGFLNGITRLASEGFSIAEINHARHVLYRLAALTKED
jgi:hypothetical protein